MTWQDFVDEAPELAAAVKARFDGGRHHVLATLRADGSPRVSGTEVEFSGSDVVLGMMAGSVKARDLARDRRFALHAHTGDGSMQGGDAKVAGVAVEVDPPPGPPSHRYRLMLGEAVLTSVHPDGDRLVIETWRPGSGVKRVERA